MSVDLSELELYSKVPSGWKIVGLRCPRVGEYYLPYGSTICPQIEAIGEQSHADIRIIVKRKTKTITRAFIEVPFEGKAKYEVTASVQVDPPYFGRVLLPVLSVKIESKEVPDEC